MNIQEIFFPLNGQVIHNFVAFSTQVTSFSTTNYKNIADIIDNFSMVNYVQTRFTSKFIEEVHSVELMTEDVDFFVRFA